MNSRTARGAKTLPQAYSPGPYSNLESQLAAFDREYLHALGQALTEEQPV